MCKSSTKDYVGHTTTTLRKRMLAHRNNGAIHQHYIDCHDKKPSLMELIENTKILHKETNYSRLLISEAVSIALQKPTLNIQQEADNILPSRRRRRQVRCNNPPPPFQRPIATNNNNEAQVESLLRSLRPKPNRTINQSQQ